MQYRKEPYLRQLRENEVYPSFSEIEELVMAQGPRKRGLALFLWPIAESAVLATVAAFLFWNASADVERNLAASPVMVINRTSLSASVAASIASPVTAARNASASVKFVKQEHGASSASSADIGSPVLQNGNVSQVDTSENGSAETAAALHDPVPTTTSVAAQANDVAEAKSSTSSPFPLMSGIESAVEPKPWEAFISGAFVMPPSGIPSGALTQSYNAEVGIRYTVGGPSSIILELRKTSFVNNRTTTNTTLTDTSVLLDGQLLQNVIGKTNSSTEYFSNPVTSLDFGYRYTLLANASISPYAEALAGGSFSGMLLSAEIGVQYAISAFAFDLGVRDDQLIASGTTPERALTFEAAAGFAW